MLKDKLKEYRLLCGYSQQQIADVLNIHRSTYSYYELGKTEPSLDNIRTLAMEFGVSLNALLEVESPTSLRFANPDSYGKFEHLDESSVSRVGDLTKDEKTLILCFRRLTEKQRKEMLASMCGPEMSGDSDSRNS